MRKAFEFVLYAIVLLFVSVLVTMTVGAAQVFVEDLGDGEMTNWLMLLMAFSLAGGAVALVWLIAKPHLVKTARLADPPDMHMGWPDKRW